MKSVPPKKPVVLILLVISFIAFGLFIPPNAAASQNLAMVRMFQPDEAEVFPNVIHMITPASNLFQALHSFIFYDYYFYGFPYFAASAVVLLPLRFAGDLENVPTAMLILRQLVSVLPMLVALLFLVFMQDGFRSYRSIVLFIFLLSVPAVVQNNLWWHPDGITFFLVVLILFFLKRDDLQLGKDFLLAALLCGIAAAVKLVGLYFFLAVGLVILLSLVLKKASWKKAVGMAFAFLLIMAATFLVSNPFLLSRWARTSYFAIFKQQTALLSEGYAVYYDKGLAAAWPLLHASYGEIGFLLVALGTALWASIRGPQQFLHRLILAWFIPLTVAVLWFTHFKFQYWLPVALPLFSSLVVLLPEKLHFRKTLADLRSKHWPKPSLRILFLIVVLVQLVLFVVNDIQLYRADLQRAEDNPRINFYSDTLGTLEPLSQESIKVYYDYRLYVPPTSGWTIETTYDLLDYGYTWEKDFHVLLLLEQRIRDYLNPEVQGIDPEAFANNQRFYADAEKGQIQGYKLAYRNSVGLIFVREDLYQQYFLK
jgi:hypothetical protein